VGYAGTNVIGSRTLFVIASVLAYIEFRSNPFQAHNLEQSYHKKYKCKNDIKLIYLTFVHCTCKSEKHKQYFLSENYSYERTFPCKKHKQSNAHEKHKQSFPSENYNRTRHAHARATSADSIPPRSL
jgi:predicted acyl esterase